MTLYFAYGSNINRKQMKQRCPKAVFVGAYVLGDSELVFRIVADCAFKKGSECQGVVWKLTPECERALDIAEGVASGVYRKEYTTLAEPVDDETELMFYVMNSDGIYPPTQEYYDRIKQGYVDFDLPLEALKKARRYAWKHKKPSWRERMRLMRKGHKPLAKDHVETPRATLPVLYDDSKPMKKDTQSDFFDWDHHGVVYGD